MTWLTTSHPSALTPDISLHVVDALVAQPGGVVHRRPHRVDLRLVHRHALPDRTEVVEVPAERRALPACTRSVRSIAACAAPTPIPTSTIRSFWKFFIVS